MFHLNHPPCCCGEGPGGRQGLALGVHWVGSGEPGVGADHDPFVLTALSTAPGERQLEARGGTASLPELHTRGFSGGFSLQLRLLPSSRDALLLTVPLFSLVQDGGEGSEVSAHPLLRRSQSYIPPSAARPPAGPPPLKSGFCVKQGNVVSAGSPPLQPECAPGMLWVQDRRREWQG